MKIAVTSTGNSLEDLMDSRFGRTKFFLIYDTESKAVEKVDNTQNLNAPQGAGIQAAMHVVEAEADAVITGHCGPKAFRVLHEAGIKVYLSEVVSASEALARLDKGELAEADNADVEGHWL